MVGPPPLPSKTFLEHHLHAGTSTTGTTMNRLPGPSFCPQHLEAQAFKVTCWQWAGLRLASRLSESKPTVLGKRPRFGWPALGSLKRCVCGFLLSSILFKGPSFSPLLLFPAEAPPKKEAFLPACQERAHLISSRSKGETGPSKKLSEPLHDLQEHA